MLSLLTLSENTFAILLLIGLFSLFIGSFLNVVIIRLPNIHIVFSRSHCPKCHRTIAWFHNIPVLSFVRLKGRCYDCRQKISLRYPAIELLTLLLSMAITIRFGFSITTLAGLALTWGLIVLAFIDIDKFILPDNITLPFLWLGLLLNIFHIFVDPASAILGATAGYLILWIAYWIFKWRTGQEGLGFGDFKLLSMLGAWLGWQSLPLIILLASLLGTIAGISLILIQKRSKNTPIPFGPFLAIAGFFALLWGPTLNNLYCRLAGL